MRLVMGATVKGRDIDEVDMATFEVSSYEEQGRLSYCGA